MLRALGSWPSVAGAGALGMLGGASSAIGWRCFEYLV